ncbi:coat protein [Thesium chinense closterovirus 1]|nr:coat protein [Thesium chinense closterovirus 1]
MAIVNSGSQIPPPVDSERDFLTVADERCLNGESLELAKKAITELIVTKGGTEEDLPFHLGQITYAYAAHSTSSKALTKGDLELLKYTFKGKSFSFTVEELNKVYDKVPALSDKNKHRVFCRSFSKYYIEHCKRFSGKLPELTRANEKGIPEVFSYLQADFLLSGKSLDLDEQAALLHGRNASLKSVTGASEKVCTSLYEFGKI